MLFDVHTLLTKRWRVALHKVLSSILLASVVIAYSPLPAFATEPAPTIDVPTLFTSQFGFSRVDKNMGALTESVALEIPPGRNGLTPELSVNYNSQDLIDGYVGYGWSLSIPYIERLNKTGSERLYTGSYFFSTLGGELATTTLPNEYRHRTEDDRFIKYTFSNNVWTAFDKNGTRYLFGTTTQARQAATSSPSNVFRWMLEEVRDANNNYIEYEYISDENQIYPSKITYTGNGTNDGVFVIDFTYETRPDTIISFKPGFKAQTKKRLTEVLASVSGSWVRKYTLSYINGVNGKRSLLSSILQTGRDESGNPVSLPAQTFGYSSSTPVYTTNSDLPQTINPAYVVADVNGNGLLDRSVFNENNFGSITTNNYPSFSTNTINPVPNYWAANDTPIEHGGRFLDINGDGKADVIRSTQHNHSNVNTHFINYYENQGTSWPEKSIATTSVPVFSYEYQGASATEYYSTGLFGNLNGDGLVDYLLSINIVSGQPPTNGGYLHSGTSTAQWALSTSTFTPVATFPSNPLSTSQHYLVDINADGLDDWMDSAGGSITFRLNTGTGWESSYDNGWYVSTSTRGTNGWDRGIRFVDINGDELPDYVRGYNVPSYGSKCGTVTHIDSGVFNYIYLNTGSGFATSSFGTLPRDIFTGDAPSNQWCGLITHYELVDWNGDGTPDMHNQISTNTKPDVLVQITYPTGGTKEVTYKYSNQFASDNPNLPFPVLVVANVTKRDGMGNAETMSYSYAGGRAYLTGDVRDRRFAGFKTITKWDPLSVVQSYFNQGDSVDTSTGEQTDDYAQIGRSYRELITTLSTTTMKDKYLKWTTFNQGDNNRKYVSLEKEMSMLYDGNSDHRDTAVEYTYSTTTGDLTKVVQKGEVNGNTNGTYTDPNSDTITKDITYAGNSSINLRVPTQETIKNNAGTIVKDSKFYYDNNLSLGSVTTGNLTKQENWISGSMWASTTKAYNSYGLVTSETDPLSKTTALTYETNNLYVSTSTNPLSQITGYAYDYSTGKRKRVIDPNNRTRESAYDGLGRLIETKGPDSSTGTLVSQSTIAYTTNVFPQFRQETRYLNSATTTETYTYLDGLGRTIQERTESGSNYSVKDKIYGNNGLLASESLPYFSSGSARTAATTSSSMLTTYAYDALRRLATSTNVLGSETRTFDQWKEKVTDRNNKPKDLISDAHGNLVYLVEYNSAPATTTYAYDALNNLTKIEDAAGNIRSFWYDGLSRATSTEDLHASGDGTYGIWKHTYDLSGNITQTIDPKNQTITKAYDAINRILTEDVGGGNTEITYAYDSCADGKGRLCAATTTDAVTSYAYNPLGLPSSETKKIGDTNYTTSYLYDRQGNLTDITYPDTSAVRYVYDDAGLLETVSRKPATGSGYLTAISELEYAPTGAITLKKFGNGVVSTYTYDPAKLYRLTNILTVASSTWGGGGPLGLLDYGNLPWRTMLAKALPQRLAIAMGLIDEAASSTFVSEEASTSSEMLPLEESILATSTEELSVGTTTLEITERVSEIQAEEQTNEIVVPLEAKSAEVVQQGPYTDKTDRYELSLSQQLPNTGAATIELLKDRPEIRLKRWNGEVDLGVSYANVQAPASRGASADRIEWKGEKEEVHAYPLPAKEGMEDGGFEIEVYLKEKPATNIFTFALSGTENLDFWYQPPLSQEAHKGMTCTDTECTDAKGKVKNKRPEHIVGSYAVYHKTQADHRAGGLNYGTGKVLHILRPKIVDANGKEIWGALTYNNGSLSVTVPQTFLDEAVYPIIVDPTFGYTSVGGSDNYADEGQTMWAKSSALSPAGTNTLNSISFYGDVDAAGDEVKFALYSHNSGTNYPNVLLDADASFWTPGTSPAWKTNPVNMNYALSASTQYWFAFATNNSSDVFNFKYDSGSSYKYTLDWSAILPNPWSTDDESETNIIVSVYGTYTSSGGNSAPTAPTSLLTEGQTNPTNISDNTPEFSAIYNDPDVGDLANKYRIQVDNNSDFSSTFWDSGTTTMATTNAGNRSPDITYGGSALASSTTYYWRIAFSDDDGATGAWSTTTATFSLAAGGGGNSAPSEPTSLLAEGQTNPTNISDNTPEFSAIYNDPDAGDQANKYRIQVATSSSFTSTFWDSGTTTMVTTTAGNRSPDISYAGSALASSTTYYWRIAFSDDDGATGAWSTATSTFSLAASGGGGGSGNPFATILQNIFYTYDAVGNIINIADYSDTGTGKAVTFGYDDLHRLTSAVTSAASSTSYDDAYTYNALGNLTSFDGTSYTYAGTNYANPHAPTTIGGLTYSYDNNGNLTGAGTKAYTWDYRNRLTAAGETGQATTTFGYDHENQRVFKKAGTSATTTYVNKYYNVAGATTTAHLFLPDGSLIATVETASTGGGGGGTSSTTPYSAPAGGDGEIYKGGSSNWTTEHDATSGTAGASDTTAYTYVEHDGSTYWLGRTALPFDTSGIPDTATITGATLKVYVSAKSDGDNDGSDTIRVVQNTTASPTALANGDYDQIGSIDNPTAGASDTDITSISTGAYLSIPLNATGLSWISKTGHTKLGLREGHDATDTAPTNSTGITGIEIRTTDYTGTGSDPILEVTYDTGGGGGGDSTSTTTSYIHSDHLGSTNVVTNASGTVMQVLDYYPFGAKRISTGSNVTERQFIGQRYDNSSALNYLNARYYSSDRGQFISQDPIFTGDPRKQNLANPQSLNSYSYAENNPVVKKDPDGLAANSADAARQAQIAAIKKQIGAIQAQINQIAASMGRIGGQFYGGMWNPFSGGSTAMNSSLPWSERTAGGAGMVVGLLTFGDELTAVRGASAMWRVGDDVYKATSKGTEPAWSTVRTRFWKNEAATPGSAEKYGSGNVDRMQKGLAPQRYNAEKGGAESMELSHEPIPAREGGTNLVPRWPQDHATVDPWRHPGY